MAKFSYRNLLCFLVTALISAASLIGSALAQEPQPAAGPSASMIEMASLSRMPDLSAAVPEAGIGTADSMLPDASNFAAPTPFIAANPSSTKAAVHPFWDRENRLLFAAVGAAATSDFVVTHANLASGGRELNPITRVFAGSTPALASNFALQTACVIGVSYMFHKTGHHKLERITSLVDFSSSSTAVMYDLAHR
jgi:hypothetical protein